MLYWALASALVLVLLGVQEGRRREALRQRDRCARELAAAEARIEAFSAHRMRVSRVVAALQRATSFAALGRAFMAQVAPTIGAHYGVLYILDKASQRLEPVGGYGLADTPQERQGFALGEGLVGQCALDRSGATIHTLPEAGVRVVSGLGEGSPRQLLLQAVVQTDRALGVLEFAALTTFAPITRELLDELMPVLAMCIEIIDRDGSP